MAHFTTYALRPCTNANSSRTGRENEERIFSHSRCGLTANDWPVSLLKPRLLPRLSDDPFMELKIVRFLQGFEEICR